MDLMEKLTLLTEGAKYDAACTSSGSQRNGGNKLGSTIAPGCCHSFSADGRCISLLKVLYTNYCEYDCTYCVNRKSNDIKRTSFTPRELAELTIAFYRRNYIEGLFLSSGILKNPDYTTEQIITALRLLREEYNFAGYIHAKAIPGASGELINALGLICDRLSINIEFPSEKSLMRLAPHKTKDKILQPMKQIAQGFLQNKQELALYKHAPTFAPAGQATQMIIGASPESDYQILRLSEGLYEKYAMKRVFYSAYVPVADNNLLPAIDTKPPLLREHRLYQADWLMRFYQFKSKEILSEQNPNFNPYLDPKCNWAIHNMAFFPVDINKAPLNHLLRVPGIGPISAKKIVQTRKTANLSFDDLKMLGVVLKRARFFITANGYAGQIKLDREATIRALVDPKAFSFGAEQISMLQNPNIYLPKGDNIENTQKTMRDNKLLLPGIKTPKHNKETEEDVISCLSSSLC